jgi:hypothetical protein
MIRSLSSLSLALAALGFTGCAEDARSAPEAAYAPVATTLQVMESITIPMADRVWAASAEAPTTEAGWVDAHRAALALAESGNLLLMKTRAPENDETWNNNSLALVRAGGRAAEAAAARNAAALNAAGDEIYQSCLGCHQGYMHPMYNNP